MRDCGLPKEVEDLRQQLRDKPLEVEAVRVVEKLPDDVQEYLSSVDNTVYHMKKFAKVNTVLEMIVGLSTEETQSWAKMMNDRNAVNEADESYWLEVLITVTQNLQEMKDDYRQGGEGENGGDE